MPVRHRPRVALLGRAFLPTVGVVLRRRALQVHGYLRRAEPVQDVRVELVGELAAHFDDLASAAVVPQGSCHLLVGHGFAVALALAPALSQLLFVLGDEVERAAAAVRPLYRVAHAGVVQGFMEILVQPELLTSCQHGFYSDLVLIRHQRLLLHCKNAKF